ncbi:MAG: twin-arginine translocase subunit TatB [Oceanospirillaceae bacterium]|nr:twin-arginine translocase subunit TatB [Oceanospirillaceae bacterium]
MFDIGFAELLIVAVVALVVLGPEKLPTAARTAGLWVGRIRRTLSGIQNEISEELRIDEMKRTAAIQKEQLDKELEEMRTPFTSGSSDDSPFGSSVSSPEELKAQQPASGESTPQPENSIAPPISTGSEQSAPDAANKTEK